MDKSDYQKLARLQTLCIIQEMKVKADPMKYIKEAMNIAFSLKEILDKIDIAAHGFDDLSKPITRKPEYIRIEQIIAQRLDKVKNIISDYKANRII